ncbi:hypothetical protein [Corallococcus carmarthensis]|nr:hypothetical protein [Corallococcus carmarthensis]
MSPSKRLRSVARLTAVATTSTYVGGRIVITAVRLTTGTAAETCG